MWRRIDDGEQRSVLPRLLRPARTGRSGRVFLVTASAAALLAALELGATPARAQTAQTVTIGSLNAKVFLNPTALTGRDSRSPLGAGGILLMVGSAAVLATIRRRRLGAERGDWPPAASE